jgi:hypothetical protein
VVSGRVSESMPIKKRVLDAVRGKRGLLMGFLVVAVLLAGYWIIFSRPAAAVNRLLPAVGLVQIPASAQSLHFERRGRFFGTQVSYIRFKVPARDLVEFVAACSPTSVDEPVPVARLHFGPRSPAWMTWTGTTQGNMYHWTPEGASVWLAVDEQSNTAYIGVFEARPAWLRWLVD